MSELVPMSELPLAERPMWGLEDEESMSPRRAMEVFWMDSCQNIVDADGEALVPFDAAEFMGVENLNEMAQRLALIRNKTIYIIKNVTSKCYILTPDEPTEAPSAGITVQAAPVPPGQGRRNPKVPRPPNCFILYRKAQHDTLRAMNPGISNNQISRVLGARWMNESEEVRARYTELAEILKRKHAIDHPDYQYAPRRPNQRRRRQPRKRPPVPAPADQTVINKLQTTNEEVVGSVSLDTVRAGEDAGKAAEQEAINFGIFEGHRPFFEESQNGQLQTAGWTPGQFPLSPIDLRDYMDLEVNDEMLGIHSN